MITGKCRFARFGVVAATVALIVTGCFYITDHETVVQIESDGKYKINSDFDITVELLEKLIEEGESEQIVRKKMEKEMQKFRKTDSVKSATVKSPSTAHVKMAESGVIDRRVHVFFREFRKKTGIERDEIKIIPMVEMSKSANGAYHVAELSVGSSIDRNDVERLRGDGVLKVCPESEVLEHNADETPGYFGSCYTWNFSGMPAKDDVPHITMKLPEYSG